jgi:O-antigen ligase
MIRSLKTYVSSFAYQPDILLILFAFFLPTFPQVSQVAILLYCLFWIKNGQYQYLSKIKENWFAIGSIAYFAIFAISIVYSENIAFWGRDMEAKLPLLVVPILLTSRKTYDEQVLKSVFWAFTAGCLVLVSCLYYEFYLGDGNIFRDAVSIKTFMNPIYFAMYLSAILLIGGFSFIQKQLQTFFIFNKSTIFQIIGLLFIHYLIYAIASRMAILATVVAQLGIVFIWMFLLKKKYLKGILLFGFVLVFNFLSLSLSQQAKARLQETGGPEEVRILLWKTAITQFSKAPIFGYGSGDYKDVMKEGYLEIGYQYGYDHGQNAHNQYLETGVSVGIVGVLVFLGWFFFAFKASWQAQNYLFCIFIAIVALNILTESMFARQQGTYFMAFLGSLLYWRNSLLPYEKW